MTKSKDNLIVLADVIPYEFLYRIKGIPYYASIKILERTIEILKKQNN
jgi:hypothetical protein